MRLKKFLFSKIFLRNLGLCILFTVVLIWLVLIFLSFYTNQGENFPTPNFRGLSIAQVETMANDQNFRYTIEDSVFRKDINPGTVVFQNPSAGHKIKPNRLISLTVASFMPEQVELPKLTDVSMRQAKELLESKGFVLGGIMLRPSEFDDLVLEQRYNGQIVEPGSRLANGSRIDLVVGKHMTGGATTMPNLKMLTLSVARNILNSRSMNIGSVIYDPSIRTSSDSLTAIIWKQVPPHDSTSLVMPGLSVDLWLKVKSESPDSTNVNNSGH